MNRSLLRYLGVTIAAMLTFAIASVGPVSARPPGWGFESIVAVPSTVSPSKVAAFDVTIKNGGKSNISSLLMATDLGDTNPLAVPKYVGDATWVNQPLPHVVRPCGNPPYTAALSCDFGNLVAGASVSLRIALPVPAATGTHSFNFVLTGNGNTPSDTGGTSHGDTKRGPASVSVSDDPNFAGGFVLDSETFSTVENLTRQNPQAGSITTTQDFEPSTIQESNSYSGTGSPCATVNCIGQWTTVTAPNPTSGNKIKVTLLILGKGVPGSVGPDDIVLYHLGGTNAERGDDGIIGDTPSERCATATDSGSAPCIYVTEEGQNFRIVAWLLKNGTLRGTW